MPLSGSDSPSASDSPPDDPRLRRRWMREQADTYEATNGAEANTLRGVPIIVLTSVGAKTGALRKTALMRVEHDGRYAVVASKGGAPDEPKWAENMRRHPLVELHDGAVTRDYIARELSGDERAEWWGYSTAVWPDYDRYQTKTDRLIAVFVLEPVES